MLFIFLGILAILLFSNIINGDFESSFILFMLMVGISFIKLFTANTQLQQKYTLLEKKIITMHQDFEERFAKMQDEKANEPKPTVAVQAQTIIKQESEEAVTPMQTAAETIPVHRSEQIITPETTMEQKSEQTVPKSEEQTTKAFKGSTLQENPIDKLIVKLKTYFTTGNVLAKVGGVILFFGLSFLIKFAVNNDMISVELGLLSVILFSIALTGIGFKYRKREGAFGLILQGIGIAVFYLAIFSAAKFFSVIPFGAALGIMVVTVIFATLLAIVQDAFYLAIFATVGGFMAPILTSTGEGSHIVLFSYYAFLNIGIVAIAWFKSWRLLNLIGFAFTFVIGTVWGLMSYQPEHFATTEPFLILFFLLYVAVAVLFAHRTSFKLKAYVDSALVFGVPTVGFGLQASLVHGTEYLLAYSSLALGALYISLAWWLRKRPRFSLLSESFLALGVLFLSMVFAFAFSPEISSVIYALESSAIIWISLRQNRLYARLFALALEFYALASFVNAAKYKLITESIFLNEVYLGFVIIALATLLSAYVYDRYTKVLKSYEAHFSSILLALGLLIWVGAGFNELQAEYYAYFLGYITLSALVLSTVSLRYRWQRMQLALEFFIPFSLLTMALNLMQVTHPFEKLNYVAIPLYFAVSYLMLARLKFKFFSDYWHVINLWMILLILTFEIHYHLAPLSPTIALSALPLLFIAAIYTILKQQRFWPLTIKAELYSDLGIQGMVLFLVGWEMAAFSNSAALTTIPYIPLLNPLDLMQVSVVVTLAFWLRTRGVERPLLLKIIAGTVIIFISLFWARLVHYYGDVGYSIFELQSSALFQSGISILYTLIALGVIVFAKRRESRSLWITGASFLGFVILKLLVTDMAQSGSLERIITFMVVGVLILIIGFIAPLPPKQEQTT